jgi:hypothetical protein
MRIEDQVGGVRVTTTDIHQVRKITEALHEPSRGNRIHYNQEENLLQVKWGR